MRTAVGLKAAVALGAVVGLGTMASPASAQGSGAAAAADQDSDAIVVTARRRVERLLDVPVAGNTLSQQTLERYSTADLTAVGVQVPQVSIDHAASGSGAIITVRGIGSPNSDAGIEQAVSVNLDGVPISRGRIVAQASFDQRAIEVLKGPQALFFGRNSPAGVISITSADPTDKLFYSVRAGYEERGDEFYGEAVLSAPVTESLGVRLAVRGSDMRGGYVRGAAGRLTDPAFLPRNLALAGIALPGSPSSRYPGNKDLTGRLTVRFDNGGPLRANLKALLGYHKDRGDSMDRVIFNCGPGQTRTNTRDLATGQFLTDPFSTCERKRQNSQGRIPPEYAAAFPEAKGGKPFTKIDSRLGSLTLDYDVADALTLTSVTGYYYFDQSQFADYSSSIFASSAANDEKARTISEELRFLTKFQGAINFSGGLFFSKEKRDFGNDTILGYLGFDPATGRSNTWNIRSFYRNSTFSAYGEATWDVMTDVELSGGARYTRERRRANLGTTYQFTGIRQQAPAGVRFIGSFVEDNVSPQVTLSWHPARDMLLYGAYKTGFQSGGFSNTSSIPVTSTLSSLRFGQEKAKGYEAGYKFSLMSGRVTGDLTGYTYRYSGLQLTVFNAALQSFFTQNAAAARVKGIEANLTFRPVRALSLRGSAAYNRARYGSFRGSQCWAGQSPALGCVGAVATGNPILPFSGGQQDLSGRPLFRAPEWSVLGGATYETPVSGTLTFGATADARYSSGYFLYATDSPFGFQKQYATLDASLRLSTERWEVAVIGKNLTDTFYGVTGADKSLGGIGQSYAHIGRPRQLFLQFTFHN